MLFVVSARWYWAWTMSESAEVVAPAPTSWGKGLRCCVPCHLVKTTEQFYDQGCENCGFLRLDGDRERIFDATTTEFQVEDGCRGLVGSACMSLGGTTHRAVPGCPLWMSKSLRLTTGHLCTVQGLVSIVDPKSSWCAKWLHHRKHVPGCYALSVEVDQLPQHIEDILADQGIKWRRQL